MGIRQEVMGVCLMMAHHAQQSRAVTQPVQGAQFAGLLRIELEVCLQITGHLPVNLGQNVGGSVVKRVVQIQQVNFAGQTRMGTTNITNAQNE